MKWYLKIRAGALQFVLFIGVVIALLLTTFILLAHSNTLFGKKTDLLVSTIKSADLGLDIALKSNLIPNDSTRLDLPFNDHIRLTALRDQWGIFERYSLVAKAKKNRFVKSVLVGSRSIPSRPALYLQDRQRPMIIVGKAQIIGDAFLPKQGIRPGNISGNSFYGKSLINGRQRESGERLPELNPGLRQHLNWLMGAGLAENTMEPLSLSKGLIAQNSFEGKTQLIQGRDIVLSGVSLTGNILVRAHRRITVHASANLRDVVLLAPEIIIKNNVKGVFQALASKRISVGKNCLLEYPSALVVNERDPMQKKPASRPDPNIYLGPASVVKGSLLYLGSSGEQPTFYPQIKIEDGAQLWGELYCEQNLEHKGTILGSVSTAGFLALESGSIYQNHLFNGTIDSAQLPAQYAGLPLVGTNHPKTVAKWLY